MCMYVLGGGSKQGVFREAGQKIGGFSGKRGFWGFGGGGKSRGYEGGKDKKGSILQDLP